MSAGALVDRYEVPFRDHRRQSGYQRPVSPARVNKLAGDPRSGRVDIPTAVLLNIRSGADEIIAGLDGPVGVFAPDGHELFVVDGQHRLAALAKLVEEDPEK